MFGFAELDGSEPVFCGGGDGAVVAFYFCAVEADVVVAVEALVLVEEAEDMAWKGGCVRTDLSWR